MHFSLTHRVDFTKYLFGGTEFLHCHTVEITEIYSHTFLAKISWKQRIY